MPIGLTYLKKLKKFAPIQALKEQVPEMLVKGEFHPLNPTPQSAELFDIYCDVAKSEGVNIEGEHSGGWLTVVL